MKTYIYLLLIFVSTTANAKIEPVNSLIGDQGFAAIMGYYPNSNSDENLRVKCHLLYVEYLLRKKKCNHLSKTKQRKRVEILDLLHSYALVGKYPENKFAEAERKPCFIDDQGVICAVGYLLETTENRAFAEEVNNKYQYSEIYEMDIDIIENWAKENGLTLEECAMIQPTYDYIWFRNYQNTLIFSLGSTFRFDKSYYSKLELAYSFNNVFKRKFRSSLSLQYIPLRSGNYSAALSYYKTVYIHRRIRSFAGVGAERFSIDQNKGWNLLPEAGISYQFIKGRMIFNTQLAFSYHISLQNSDAYQLGRSEVSALIGLGFRL